MAEVTIPSIRTIQSPVSLYTSEEVAAILKVSRRSVQRLIQRGRLKGFRLGLAYRVTAEDLVDFCRGPGRDP
jgi:excisionase family DNA binding protein